MSSDGKEVSDSNDSAEAHMVWFEEVEDDLRVVIALQTIVNLELVCIDSGANRLILVLSDYFRNYVPVHNSTLRTANSDEQAGSLRIGGRGLVGNRPAIHVPTATANLMNTDSIVDQECKIEMGKNDETSSRTNSNSKPHEH